MQMSISKKGKVPMEEKLPWPEIDPLIEGALKEDLKDRGDITTKAIIPRDMKGKGRFLVQEDGIIAGLPVVQRVFEKIDSELTCVFSVEDGTSVHSGMIIGEVYGSLASILKGERTALNFLQRLSGIATLTAQFVQAVQGTKVKILDTRKTTPQLRLLEKYAVRKGGGENHRFGLYDMVLIKDNHIDAVGSLKEAIERCLDTSEQGREKVKIEVETRTLEEVREAVKFPIDRIMLDNMDVKTIEKAVAEVNGKVELEASGNITLENIRVVAETGVDYISVGRLTHSPKALDVSLKLLIKT